MSQAITKSFVKKHEKEIKSLLNEIEEDRNCKGKILVIVSEEVIKKIGEIYFCQNKFSRPIFMYTPPSSLEITLTRKQEKIVKPFIKNLLKHEIQNSQFGFNNKPDMTLKSKTSSVDANLVGFYDTKDKYVIQVSPTNLHCINDNGVYKFSN